VSGRIGVARDARAPAKRIIYYMPLPVRIIRRIQQNSHWVRFSFLSIAHELLRSE